MRLIIVPKIYFGKFRDYQGVKFLFLQDEYENVNSTSEAMAELGIDIYLHAFVLNIIELRINMLDLEI